MDILIKSFYRPYYLDRCLYSIEKFVKGVSRVIILDDGTPSVYLEKIKQKYPYVIIHYSESYAEKIKNMPYAIETGLAKFSVMPIHFWRSIVQDATEYFVMMEDDVWITHDIDLGEYAQLMKQEDLNIIKFRWWNNPIMEYGIHKPLSKDVDEVIPKLPLLSESIIKNRYYLHSILSRLKLLKKDAPFYFKLRTLCDVAGHAFSKDFWLHIWPSSMTYFEEMIQLGKALEWKRKYPKYRFAKTKEEFADSTYLTSTAGAVEKLGFSMFEVNYILNEAWLKNEFDITRNFPKDFTIEDIVSILENGGMKTARIQAWKHWSEGWKTHFKSIGCIVD